MFEYLFYFEFEKFLFFLNSFFYILNFNGKQ